MSKEDVLNEIQAIANLLGYDVEVGERPYSTTRAINVLHDRRIVFSLTLYSDWLLVDTNWSTTNQYRQGRVYSPKSITWVPIYVRLFLSKLTRLRNDDKSQ